MSHTTTWDHNPHGSDGKLDYGKLAESLDWGKQQLLQGNEALLGAAQTQLTDGTFLTIYHHAPASHPHAKSAIAALAVYVAAHPA